MTIIADSGKGESGILLITQEVNNDILPESLGGKGGTQFNINNDYNYKEIESLSMCADSRTNNKMNTFRHKNPKGRKRKMSHFTCHMSCVMCPV